MSPNWAEESGPQGLLPSPWGGLAIERASAADAAAVLALRDDLAAWMVGQGILQWQPGEISLARIETLISEGSVYTVRHGASLIASVTITWNDRLIWGDQDRPAGYVHMLMVARLQSGQGVGRSLLSWAEGNIRRCGRLPVRLDCVRSNRRLRIYYEELGYDLVGYRTFGEAVARQLGFTPPETALYEKS